jgi:Cu/Ag efflux protein CusF
MTHKLGKFSTLSLGVLVVTGSFAIAAGPQDQKSSQSSQSKPGYSSQQQEQSGSQKSQMQSSGTPVMGSRASTIVFATVNEVKKEQNTVTLQTSDGSMMEMDVPEEALSNLQKGDIVEVTVDKLTAVTIDKVHDAQQSAMSGKTQGSQQSAQQSKQSSDSGTSSQAAQSRTATPATVEAVDSQQGKITLRMEKSGNTVEMQVPEALLSDLESGDSVQVSIRKSQQSQSSGSQSPNSKSQSR